MNLGTVWVNGKEMRRGYTTGSCAAAAAKAAVTMLFSKEEDINQVRIMTPAGIELDLEVHNIRREKDRVSCSIQKDGGDDPDVTHGLHIFATAKKGSKGIRIDGGEGVGRVTLPGLPVPVGEPAINPVPRQMILEEIKKVLPPGEGVDIVFSIPGGEDIAKKTFNPRLGIKGGLSILGTTGIVEPMSEGAWKESLRLELKVLKTKGYKKVIMVPGNYGWDFACSYLGLEGKPMVKISNFVGYMLKQAEFLGFEDILIVGDLGKLIKVSAGIFHTHSGIADARMEIMAAYAASMGAEQDMIVKILSMNTTGAVIDILENEWNKERLKEFHIMIAHRVSQRASLYINHGCRVGTVLFSMEKGLLAMDDMANEMIKGWRDG